MSIQYHDGYADVFEDSIVIKKYYFPIPLSKRIDFNEIESISIETPNIKNGKWRIWGSGNLNTWFPLDFDRHKRNKMFIISIKDKRFKIGLTVTNPDKLTHMLGKYNLLAE